MTQTRRKPTPAAWRQNTNPRSRAMLLLAAFGAGLAGLVLVCTLVGHDGRGQAQAQADMDPAKRRELEQAQAFVAMLENEEEAFFVAMDVDAADADLEAIQAAADQLDQRTDKLELATADWPELHAIVADYNQAVDHWQEGLHYLAPEHLDPEKFQALFKRGDTLRTQAADAFEARYAGGRAEF